MRTEEASAKRRRCEAQAAVSRRRRLHSRYRQQRGASFCECVLPPGTTVIMTLEANLKTKHGVPAVAEAGPSGSVVLRTITERVEWACLQKKLAA